MATSYPHSKLTENKAEHISSSLFGISGKAQPLPGEVDSNFSIKGEKGSFLLKVSRPDADPGYLEYQQLLLQHVSKDGRNVETPTPMPDKEGKLVSQYRDDSGQLLPVRLLTWIEGRLWSSVHPIHDDLLFSLGEEAGRLTRALEGFDHPLARRSFDWDIAQAGWTREVTPLFSEDQRPTAAYFQDLFDQIQDRYSTLRKSLVHNDANDNNVAGFRGPGPPESDSHHRLWGCDPYPGDQRCGHRHRLCGHGPGRSAQCCPSRAGRISSTVPPAGGGTGSAVYAGGHEAGDQRMQIGHQPAGRT
jgi:Ser/Thr protein kinase RdoA (MazF antagonist)